MEKLRGLAKEVAAVLLKIPEGEIVKAVRDTREQR